MSFYIPKKLRNKEVLVERLICETKAYANEIMVLVAMSKTGQTLGFFVQSNTQINTKYYGNVLFKKTIIEKNRQAKDNRFLFMQDRACLQTANLTLEMLKDKEKLWLLEPHPCLENRSDLNPVDIGIWGLLQQNALQGCRATYLASLKEDNAKDGKLRKKLLINVLKHLNIVFDV